MTTELATTKQIKFIKDLNADFNGFDGLTKAEASRIIGRLLKEKKAAGATATAAAGAKAPGLDAVLASKDWDGLYKKYNAKIEKDTEGWHGLNDLKKIGSSTAQIKKYFSNILKNEFPGLDFEIKASFKNWNNYIYITLLNVKYLTFAEAATLAGKHGSAFQGSIHSCIYRKLESNSKANILKLQKYVYENCIKKGYCYSWNGTSENFLHDDYKKLVDFLNAFLASFSYNHSDMMTDYYSYGLDYEIKIFTDAEHLEGYQAFEKISDDAFINSLEEITPEENVEIEKREEENRQKWDAYRAEEEAKREQEKAEAERLAKQYAQEKAEALECVECCACDIVVNNCITNNLKNSSIEEAHEHADSVGACHILKEINFTNEKAFKLFTSHLTDDWDILDRIGGSELVDASTLAPVELKEANNFYNIYKYDLKALNILHLTNVILIKNNGVPCFLVNTEGYSCTRYIYFLPEDVETNAIHQTSTEALQLPDLENVLNEEENKLLNEIKNHLLYSDDFNIYNFKKAASYRNIFLKELSNVAKYKIKDGLYINIARL